MKRFKKTSLWALLGAIVMAAIGCGGNTDNKSNTVGDKLQKKTAIPEVKKEPEKKQFATMAEALADYGKSHPQNKVLIKTSLGDIKVLLYEDTPLHRANFIKLAAESFYDKTVFYRVIKGFMIQGGASEYQDKTIADYMVPNEMTYKHFHKRGALAMASPEKNNPRKESSSHDFYIVQGKKFKLAELNALEEQYQKKLLPAQIAAYQKIGGAPHLDYDYTVFGEVIEGMDVVDKITEVRTDKGGWPYTDVTMKVSVIE